jgi:hypothetical protein
MIEIGIKFEKEIFEKSPDKVGKPGFGADGYS